MVTLAISWQGQPVDVSAAELRRLALIAGFIGETYEDILKRVRHRKAKRNWKRVKVAAQGGKLQIIDNN